MRVPSILTSLSPKLAHFSVLVILFFFSSFVYNLLCPLKKAVILYIPGIQPEAMVYLKLLFIAPGSLALTALFLFLSSRLQRKWVFRIFSSIFFSYFFLYTFVFSPYKESWALSACQSWSNHPAVPLFVYWMDTFFAVASELWGTAIVSLLIWGFVNQSMSIDQAQKKYVFLTLGVNSSAILSGWLSLEIPKFFHGWNKIFSILQYMVLFSIFITAVLYEYLEASYYFDSLSEKTAKRSKTAYAQKNLSLYESMLRLYQHPRLLYIACLVIAYNTVYIFSDVLFIQEMSQFFGQAHKVEANTFLTYVSMMTGVFATFLALVVYPLALRLGSWLGAGLMTPILYMITGALFYGALVSGSSSAIAGYSLSLLLGGIHLSLLRGARYSVFDATKEIAYVGLDKDLQIEGKSIIDGLISRLGKSTGSLLIFLLLSFCCLNLKSATPYLIILAALLSVLWIYAVIGIYRHTFAQTDNHDRSHKKTLALAKAL